MSAAPRKLTLPPISAAEPGALYQQIVEGLKREVSEGRLAAGAALPSFRSLAEELLVSVISKQAVFAELLAAVQDEDRTVLISSHALTDLERFADHIGMIKNGRLLFEGSTTDVVGRFRMVDFIAAEAVTVTERAGVFVQEHDGRRWRVLLDLQRASLDWLRALGVTLVADTPVTLEELFIALGKA